jgi:hypothetical protein
VGVEDGVRPRRKLSRGQVVCRGPRRWGPSVEFAAVVVQPGGVDLVGHRSGFRLSLRPCGVGRDPLWRLAALGVSAGGIAGGADVWLGRSAVFWGVHQPQGRIVDEIAEEFA